ncbi:sterol desaturase family protein [Methyloceanibacter sp.]|uniref:sterol desaturase family protein n=1 Tax=Methyloceanibacter sp. TaxID=1965321 RepID=UPI0035652951
MQNVFDQSDGLIRLGVFAGVFLVMALVEFAWPKRTLVASKGRRWLTNLGISVTANVVLRAMAALAVPIAAIAAAFYAQANGIGLLNAVNWPGWIKIVIALVVFDLAIWAQHLVSHKVPILWRLHKVHHADRDIDVTTAVRFHPFEIALSMLWKIVVVVPLGASPFAVFLFEVILNGCAMFNHANVALPAWLDRTLRLFIVTPDMHRVHHSVLRREHDSNYGFNLSLWDRLFRTYTAQPEGGHQRMKIGLTPYQSEDPSRFGWSLLLPFWPGGGNTATTEVSKEQLQGGAHRDGDAA